MSIVMLTCGRWQFLNRAVLSVVGQRFHAWELIVVHDGDDRRVSGAMAEWVRRDPRVRYFNRPTRGNIGNACNFGLLQACGDYVAILDDDDCWVAQDKLARQVEFLDLHPDHVACGGGMIVVDRHANELMRYLKWEDDEQIKRWALIANPMANSTTMFRRLVGGQPIRYDETLAGFQDWDLWLRLGQLGKLHNFQDVFTCYTLWDRGGSFEQERANARSAFRIVWRHRAAYRRLELAVAMTAAHLVYAHLPAFLRQHSFARLSRFKKRLFGARPGAAQRAPTGLDPLEVPSDRGVSTTGQERELT